MFVFTDALVRNHSLQTAQNLLQEEVVHAEEHSEVCCRNRVLCLCNFTVSFVCLKVKLVGIKAPISEIFSSDCSNSCWMKHKSSSQNSVAPFF